MNSNPCELDRICESLRRSLGVSEEVASRLAVSGYVSVAEITESSREALERITGLDRNAVEILLANARNNPSRT
jgi:hypothetical protein